MNSELRPHTQGQLRGRGQQSGRLRLKTPSPPATSRDTCSSWTAACSQAASISEPPLISPGENPADLPRPRTYCARVHGV